MTNGIIELRRCAIYTRKSTPSPDGQDITSLEAQRAICASYVASQTHKGWLTIDKPYDDPGVTGATLDRPALQALLKDIEDGLVDVVLVYKMDRVTRSLLDFIRLVEFFDRFNVTFVSITQNFDTSDAMGRLVRNILLTFAEFEREITRDRARDKKLVMKKSGRFTGGFAPIGYDLIEGKLIVNQNDAPIIRRIFEAYVELQRAERVYELLVSEDLRSKVWVSKGGRAHGGTVPSLGAIFHIIENPVYIGDVGHLGQTYRGIHEPIIDPVLWEQVQRVREERQRGKWKPVEHVLSGLLRDAYGRKMYALRPRGIRAYQSKRVGREEKSSIKLLRINAERVEQVTLAAIRSLLVDPVALRRALLDGGTFSGELDQLCNAGPTAARRLPLLPTDEAWNTNKLLIERIEVGFDRLRIYLRFGAVAAYLRWDGIGLFRLDEFQIDRAKKLHLIEVPVQLYPRQKAQSLSVRPVSEKGRPNAALVALLDDAAEAQKQLYEERDQPITELARRIRKQPNHFLKLVRLNYLAPDIKAAIIDGTQPKHLTRNALMKMALPLDWAHQRMQLGFSPVTYQHGYLPP